MPQLEEIIEEGIVAKELQIAFSVWARDMRSIFGVPPLYHFERTASTKRSAAHAARREAIAVARQRLGRLNGLVDGNPGS